MSNGMAGSKLLPPFCLMLAMLLLVTAFIVITGEPPAENVRLHEARAVGNELMEGALKQQLLNQLRFRYLLLAALIGGSLLMVCVGFLSMRDRS